MSRVIILCNYCICIIVSGPPFVARDTLKAWQEKNHPWLQLSDVHRETTEGIRVTVIPFYMGCRVSVHVVALFVVSFCITDFYLLHFLCCFREETYLKCLLRVLNTDSALIILVLLSIFLSYESFFLHFYLKQYFLKFL